MRIPIDLVADGTVTNALVAAGSINRIPTVRIWENENQSLTVVGLNLLEVVSFVYVISRD